MTPSEKAVAGLSRRFGTMPKFVGLVRAMVSPLDTLQTATQAMLEQLDLSRATGVFLDLIGVELNQPRSIEIGGTSISMNDVQYQNVLFAIGGANRAKGDRDTWVTLMLQVVNSPANVQAYGTALVHLFDSGAMWIGWTIWRLLSADEKVIYAVMARLFRGTGVRLGYVYGLGVSTVTSTVYVGFPGDTQVPTGFSVMQRGTYEGSDAVKPYFLEGIAL
jgi:hypothetical protein